jgi:hypothetical protein
LPHGSSAAGDIDALAWLSMGRKLGRIYAAWFGDAVLIPKGFFFID